MLRRRRARRARAHARDPGGRARKEHVELRARRAAPARSRPERDARAMTTACIIRGGRVLAGSELVRADVLIENDRIAAVGGAVAAPAAARMIDATGRLVVPGLINAHTHAASHLARGRAGNWTLEDLLVHAPANYAFRSPDDDYLSAAVGAIEMLKTGCTAAYDLYMPIPPIT